MPAGRDGDRLDPEVGAAGDVGRRVADDDDLLAGDSARPVSSSARRTAMRRQVGAYGRVRAVGADLEVAGEAGRTQLHAGAADDVAGHQADEHVGVGGERGDQLTYARKGPYAAVAHLAAQRPHVEVEAVRRGLASISSSGTPRGARQVAHDLRVGAAVVGVVVGLPPAAVDLVEGPPDGAPAGAVGVDQRAVDVEEGESLGLHVRRVYRARASGASRLRAGATRPLQERRPGRRSRDQSSLGGLPP